MYSAIEKYDKRDFTEKLVGNVSLYMGQENAIGCFSNIKYNQNLVDRYSCTGQAACGVISDVTGFALPLTFRKDVWAAQLLTSATPNKGDYIQNGMKQAVKLFNEEYPELPYYLKYYRVGNIRDESSLNILKFSSILTGYKGSLYHDAQDNGVIDNLDNPDGGGHAIRLVKGRKDGFNISYKYCDNYEGHNKFNIIEVPELNNSKDFFKGGYYLKKIYK